MLLSCFMLPSMAVIFDLMDLSEYYLTFKFHYVVKDILYWIFIIIRLIFSKFYNLV